MARNAWIKFCSVSRSRQSASQHKKGTRRQDNNTVFMAIMCVYLWVQLLPLNNKKNSLSLVSRISPASYRGYTRATVEDRYSGSGILLLYALLGTSSSMARCNSRECHLCSLRPQAFVLLNITFDVYMKRDMLSYPATSTLPSVFCFVRYGALEGV